jgi:hypothetical protein
MEREGASHLERGEEIEGGSVLEGAMGTGTSQRRSRALGNRQPMDAKSKDGASRGLAGTRLLTARACTRSAGVPASPLGPAARVPQGKPGGGAADPRRHVATHGGERPPPAVPLHTHLPPSPLPLPVAQLPPPAGMEAAPAARM